MMVNGLRRWTNERFEEALKDAGGKYRRVGDVINAVEMVEVVCTDCGTKQRKRPTDVDRGMRLGCRKCAKLDAAKETYDKFVILLDKEGYTHDFSVSDLVVESTTPSTVVVEVSDSGGNPRRLNYNSFAPKIGRKKTKWSTETISEWVKENAPGYLFIGDYVTTKTKSEFKCPDKHLFEATPNGFMYAHRRCPECARIAHSERMSGENSVFYDPTMTDEEREALAEARQDAKYAQFRRDVLKRDNHECQVCKNEEQLEVHHVFSFKTHADLRTNPNNGITLCNGCHVDFHRKYGFGNNTLNQFTEWLTNDHLIEKVRNRLLD